MLKKHGKFILALMVGVVALGALLPGIFGAAKPDREPYEFTMYTNYDWFDVSPKFGEDKVSAELKKKFNITMKLSKPEGDPVLKLNIMAATDDLPDTIMLERDANYQKLINLNKLIPLDKYIANNSNYKKVVNPKTINLSKVNGKIYGMLNWPMDVTSPVGGNEGWVINEKIYQQMGSPKLETTEDLVNYLKLIRNKNPAVDGKPVVPFQFGGINDIYMMYKSFGGFSREYVYPDKGKLKLIYNDPKFEKAMLFLNRLWREDLMNKDFFVERFEQVTEKLSTGRLAVFASMGLSDNVRTSRLRMQEIDPTNDYRVIEPIAGPGIKQKDIKGHDVFTIGWNIICISNKAKKPARIFEYFDYIISNEGQCLLVYGPKGEMYEKLDEKGFPILTKTESDLSEAERRALGIWTWTIPGDGIWVDVSKYAADSRRPPDKRDWMIQAQARVLARHKWNADEFMHIFTDPKTPEGIAYSSFEDLNNRMLPKIITAKTEAEAKTFFKETLENAYKLGFEKTEVYKTAKWKETLKLIGK